MCICVRVFPLMLLGKRRSLARYTTRVCVNFGEISSQYNFARPSRITPGNSARCIRACFVYWMSRAALSAAFSPHDDDDDFTWVLVRDARLGIRRVGVLYLALRPLHSHTHRHTQCRVYSADCSVEIVVGRLYGFLMF